MYHQCPECGMTLKEVVAKSRMGCGSCYDRFRSQIEPILAKIHGAVAHTGKRPVGDSAAALAAAVAAENYELAARIKARLKSPGR